MSMFNASTTRNQWTTFGTPAMEEIRSAMAQIRMLERQNNLDLLALKETPPCRICGKKINVRLPRTVILCRCIWHELKRQSAERSPDIFGTVQIPDRFAGLDVEFHEDG